MPDAPSSTEEEPAPAARKDQTADEGVQAEFEDGELALPYWLTSTEEAANTSFFRMLRRLPRLLRDAWLLAWRASRRTTAAVVVFQVFGGVASAVGMISVVGVFNGLLTEAPTPERVRAAIPSLLLLVGAAALRGGLASAAAAANGRLAPKVFQAAEMRLLALTTRVDLSTFDNADWRDAMERARDRGISAAEQLVNRAIELTTNVVGLIAAAGVLAVLHPVLLPLLVLSVVPIAWAAVRSARLNHRRMLRLIAVWRRQRMLAELLAAREPAAELRAFTLRSFLLDEIRRLLTISTNEEIRVTTRQVRTTLVGTVLSAGATGVTYTVLLWLLWTGRMELAAGGAAAYAVSIGIGKLREMALTANRLFEQGLYFSDFQGFCELSQERAEPAPGGKAPRHFTEITLRGVTFSYPDAQQPAVRDVDMTLRRGEVIALVGENGSGKSTLATLLAGLHRPQHGTIRWDEADATSFDPDSVRERVAVVMQEPTRWPLSARLNITIGRHQRVTGMPEVQAAARAGDAHEFVMELARQYETLLSRHFTDGADLSGGQWQRLAVSRSFYRDAPLLICDEPTANLDARAEHAVYQRLRELAAGRTVVLITHRMASVREADRIYVLDHGTVVEQGDHESLMAVGGIYAQLFTLQASAYQSA
ncbi:ATP-binding cassette domain-containing protein [Actinoplanes sp. TBRC 11911]|uniref:ABC transporter ATP-binding protein n=1 Tax=Actinoplanes sp. TBRC 11911 TaxID=2729386 RepID=UPI00145C7FE6|nr:ATP-binding cassette domain-containing protein [Actinoplanes sp. TBRC 11911]NMO53095.1 ATP-binding cassette domain-containing protein [Actinoplanes sp. TBRC 11911]